ncbi:MCM DNA helicase complex subunit [Hanseniaspora valbyensis]
MSQNNNDITNSNDTGDETGNNINNTTNNTSDLPSSINIASSDLNLNRPNARRRRAINDTGSDLELSDSDVDDQEENVNNNLQSSPTRNPGNRRGRLVREDDMLQSSIYDTIGENSNINNNVDIDSDLVVDDGVLEERIPDESEQIRQIDDANHGEEEDDDEDDEDDNGVDLMNEQFLEKDYNENRKDDNYDVDDRMIDDRFLNSDRELNVADRRVIDRQLNARDRMLERRRRNDDLLSEFGSHSDMDFALPNNVSRRHKRTGGHDAYYGGEDDDDLDEELDEGLYDLMSLDELVNVTATSYADWVSQQKVADTIFYELQQFLIEYQDENGRSVYGNRIRILGEMNLESLEVSYKHLAESRAILAFFLIKAPEQMLKLFDAVAMTTVISQYPEYGNIHQEIHVRIIDYPVLNHIRDLRETNLQSLIKVHGVITRRTGVFPQLKYVKFDCLKCGQVLGPIFQDSNQEVKINYCSNCKSKGPFKMNMEKTVYRNYQKLTIQESPGSVPAGRLPRHREVILLWDLVDTVKPGEEIDVVGIYKNTYDGVLNAKTGFPVFSTIIEANSVKRREGFAGRKSLKDKEFKLNKENNDDDVEMGLSSDDDNNSDSNNNDDDGNDSDDELDPFAYTEKDEQDFIKLSKEKYVIDKIISSIAPSIYGHKDIKTAVACSLFGGVAKNINGKHSIRGDINVLLLGDPGTAKSQILKYVEKTSHRAVFATGQGASAVGLTASVRKDPITKEWTLEGGALVLADKGVCIIDEFDKMNDQDRVSIHEAMEQQSISISKAGIVTSLQARCSIIAAANPISGKYNSTLTLSQNVNLTEPILSRFDILCVVRDLVDENRDRQLAQFVTSSHMRSHPSNKKTGLDGSSAHQQEQDRLAKEAEISPIPQRLLMKYIHYAKSKYYPKLLNLDQDKVARVYADLRRESIQTGSFPITIRHLESILRIAESFAKMRLSDFVSSSDLDRAIQVTVDSFIGTQKVSVKKQLQKAFAVYNVH